MENKQDSSQDIAIAEIKRDICYLKKEISEIKNQVFNHLPAAINSLNQDFQKYKLTNSRWFVSILVSLLFVLAGIIFNLIAK